jgi:putative addiction module component (TIGR02574 family)
VSVIRFSAYKELPAMSTDFAELEAQALQLPPEDRARLADHLLASLAEGSQDDIDAAWAEELERRIADVDAGRTSMVTAEEALQRARAALR